MIIHDPERRAERDALLMHLTATLEADPRVCAAWLSGSLGRGDADDLSDIDVWVIVQDEYAEAVKAARRTYVVQIGEPLLIEEAPQNAPPDGAYLAVLYRGQTGPVIVDWYWQSLSAARLLPNCLVLFDRTGIPMATLEKSLSPGEHGDAAVGQAIFFWMMVNIAAKTIARGHSWSALELITAVRLALEDVRWHVGIRPTRPDHKLIKSYADPLPVLSVDQLAFARQLAHEMEALHPHIAALAGHAPDDVVAPTFTFLERVESRLRTT